MILALLLAGGAVAMLATLLFSLSIYALPVAVGLAAGTLAYQTGAGLVGAGIVALATGAVTHAVGQTLLGALRSTALRLVVLLLFAAPAAIAGFSIADHILAWGMPSPAWRFLFAVGGGLATGAAAWSRLLIAPSGRDPGGSSAVADHRGVAGWDATGRA